MVQLRRFEFKPHDTAVIVVDVQKDFCSDKKGFAFFDRQEREGKKGEMRLIHRAVDRILPFIEKIRKANGHIVYIQSTYLHGKFPEMPDLCLDDSPGKEFFRVKPQTGDAIFGKDSHNPFQEPSALGKYLRQKGFKKALVVGVTADNCVRATAHGLIKNGLTPIILSDCTATAAYKRAKLIETLKGYRDHKLIHLAHSNHVVFG